MNSEDEKGFILEVDLEYPRHLHNSHQQFPLAPESFDITYQLLSEYAKQFVEPSYKSSKLCQTLLNKDKYVLHIEALRYYMAKGLKVSKVHRAVSFSQSPWLAKYISHNTELRKKASSEFEKDFYKLLNNSIYGKTLQNNRKHIDVRVVTSEKKCQKLTAKPQFKRFEIISDNVVLIELMKKNVVLDRPIYVGLSVLDLSKLHMYRFHYDVMLPRYGENLQLLFTDTDSLAYHIKTENLYQDYINLSEHFDLSNFKVSHPCFSSANKKVLGKFKDECADDAAIRFVGLRSKMYSLELLSEKSKQTAKGIPQRISRKRKIDEYEDVLVSKVARHEEFQAIQSKADSISTNTVHKISLALFDDKRIISLDGVSSVPYGFNP